MRLLIYEKGQAFPRKYAPPWMRILRLPNPLDWEAFLLMLAKLADLIVDIFLRPAWLRGETASDPTLNYCKIGGFKSAKRLPSPAIYFSESSALVHQY